MSKIVKSKVGDRGVCACLAEHLPDIIYAPNRSHLAFESRFQVVFNDAFLALIRSRR
jgi:hypothetical protein